MSRALTLADVRDCFSGIVPSVIATVAADGTPNVTYLSKAHPVDDERIAVSNQFLSKSSRNVAENPAASLLMVRASTHEEFRLSMVYERTERRGPIFDRLRNEISMVAALTGMKGVFRLLGADIYRVTDIEQIGVGPPPPEELAAGGPAHSAIGELCGRISRCRDLDALVRVTVDGMAELLGYGHIQLLLLDEPGASLFTIASHGYDTDSIGAEIAVGEGVVGTAAALCEPVNLDNVSQAAKYGRSIRRSYEQAGHAPAREVPLAGLARPGSQLAVPALALGQLIGALLVESERPAQFTPHDAATLTVIGSLVASSVESLRTEVATAGAIPSSTPATDTSAPGGPVVHVRHFVADGSTFLDADYLIKGVAGKLLWSLLRHHEEDGRTEFTNREMRLDPTLELPDFRDNFESRLILLKRRLDERAAPVRIEKLGRGRFRLNVDAPVTLQLMPA
jgi:adenylate cyclase